MVCCMLENGWPGLAFQERFVICNTYIEGDRQREQGLL